MGETKGTTGYKRLHGLTIEQQDAGDLPVVPEGEQAEVIRRLGQPQPNRSLAAVVDAWNSLPEAIRAGIVAMVKAAGAAAT
ncbi:MAG TPA: hypothetical protein VMV69_04440 [Pirellulales bacterium]|nr:hypothetical protein [Pirellulales bacterium]